MNWNHIDLTDASHLVSLTIAGMIVAICVMLHYEALRFLGRTLGAHVHERIRVLLVMLGLLITHFVEIWYLRLPIYLWSKDRDLVYNSWFRRFSTRRRPKNAYGC